MIKGGYSILDLRDVSFTPGVGVEIKGSYNRLEGRYRKPVLLSGIVVEDVEYPDVNVNPQDIGGSYALNVTLGVSDYTVTISDTDTVTFTVKD